MLFVPATRLEVAGKAVEDALDGGRLFMLIVARLLHKPLTEAVEEQVVGASFAVLMVLLVIITVVDVKRFF